MINQLGIIGLGTMGANIARNAARNGAKVVVFNRTTEKTKEFMQHFSGEGNFIEADSLQDLIAALDPPRAILLMVKAGEAVDDIIDELTGEPRAPSPEPRLSSGDILIDAGNSHYKDTARRDKILSEKGIRFIGMGVSGGEEGALHGPSMMPGGNKEAFDGLKELFQKMSADDGDGGKCIAYLGPDGAGHFVKMVHNGIEYGIMQLIAEAYHLMKDIAGLKNGEIATVFDEWMKSSEVLNSFLIEITAKVFTKKDDDTQKDLIDLILDKAGQKGTGKWTTDAAMQYGVAVPIITAAVDARIISSAKDFRTKRSTEIQGALLNVPVSPVEFLKELKLALEISIISAYSEGFLLITAAASAEGWNINAVEIPRIWRGGCIIRSKILERYQEMFSGNASAVKDLRGRFDKDGQEAWRSVVMTAVGRGIPVPSMQAALMSFDAYRSAWLPQNLIQAQRDFFGAHMFERADREGMFHAKWE